MLQITPQHRLLLAVEPIDFRKGICGIKAQCQQKLLCAPFSGIIFAFTNRARTSVKLLAYDANGFWLCQKRFSQGKLAWWPTSKFSTVSLRASELQILLELIARCLSQIIFPFPPTRTDHHWIAKADYLELLLVVACCADKIWQVPPASLEQYVARSNFSI
jgi:transposase